jgi:hypothetical protein
LFGSVLLVKALALNVSAKFERFYRKALLIINKARI